jgi:sugar phosphate isomerase/epimerase
MTLIDRRQVLRAVAAAPMAASLARMVRAAEANADQPTICAFSKHLQFLDYEKLGAACRDIGVDGVDLTVRRGGHVEPESVQRDLPAAVDAIGSAGVELSMITTNLHRGDDPHARPILEAASKLGVQFFRVGGMRYDGRRSPAEQLPAFTRQLRSLAELAAEYNMTAAYHNHSGANQVGGPVWDLYRMLQTIDSPYLGSNFDPGHAVVEGAGGAWRAHAQLLAPYAKTMSVKDFVWNNNRPDWLRLSEGVVPQKEILGILRAAGFAGPISIHVEYEVGSHEAMIDELRRSTVTLRELIAATN